MKLNIIKGRTYFIKGGTNTGVYLFEDDTALIIDPGLRGIRPSKIISLFEENGIKVKYIINTHEHNDHYGSCNQFREKYEDLKIMSSEYAKIYIENPDMLSNYIVGGKTNDFLEGILKNKTLEKFKIDETINEGTLNFDSGSVDIINFKGHTLGSIGVLTNDKVLFVGDLLIGKDILKRFDFLFLFDIQKQLDSLMKLKNMDFKYLVLGHSRKPISKEESEEIIELNELAIYKYINQVRKYLESPITLENLLKNIIKNNKLSNNYKEYHFFKSSLVSLISYLIENNEIEYILDDGELLYYVKNK